MTEEAVLIQNLKSPSTREKAFTLLLDQYQQRLYWHIRKIVLLHEDADDVLQNTFIKIYKGLPKFKGNSTLHTWMYRIAYNEAISFITKKQKRLRISSEELTLKILSELKEDVYFEGDEIQFQLQKAINTLPEKQKRVFQMRYFDDLKFSEISEILGTSLGALKASYHLAHKKVEQFLKK